MKEVVFWPFEGGRGRSQGSIHVEVRHGTPAQKDPWRSFRWATEAQRSPGPHSRVSGVPGLDPDLLTTRMPLSQVQVWPVGGFLLWGLRSRGEATSDSTSLLPAASPETTNHTWRVGAGEDTHPGGGNNGVSSAAGEWVAEKGGVFSL